MKKNPKQGIFITIEGPDGCGKSTQADVLVAFLKAKNHSVTLTREPGGCSIGEEIRGILLKPRGQQNLSNETELFLFAAARAQHVRETILPALDRGNIVVASRFIDATTAYQGYGRGLPIESIHDVNKFATGGLKPDLTIILDIDSEKGIHRARGVNEETPVGEIDRIESESIEFHKRVRKGYLEIVENEPERCILIDSDRPISEVSKDIKNCITEHFDL